MLPPRRADWRTDLHPARKDHLGPANAHACRPAFALNELAVLDNIDPLNVIAKYFLEVDNLVIRSAIFVARARYRLEKICIRY